MVKIRILSKTDDTILNIVGKDFVSAFQNNGLIMSQWIILRLKEL